VTVTLTGWLRCKDAAERAAVILHLPDHLRLSLAEPGCLAFAVEPTEDPLVWRVSESFVDAAAFDAHQARTRASDWFAATGGIRLEFQRIVQAGHLPGAA
jgi:quinol monooxygenase YgiN